MRTEGRFIAIEGIDAAGKKTQSGLLFNYLNEKGTACELMSFPDYAGPIGRVISGYLGRKHKFDAKVLFLLHAADMANSSPRIRQLLMGGRSVIADVFGR